MKPIWIFIIIIFLSGLYVTLTYSSATIQEGFKPRCPNILVQSGDEILLKNTNLADIPGVNPIIFHNLEEYTEFVDWQHSQGIQCPILFLQKTYSTQNEPIYKIKPIPKHLSDASRNDPPYNKNSYPGMDPTNQDIGNYTMLDKYGEVGEEQPQSANAMDPNWGGVKYTVQQIKAGVYKDDEILK
jgi:hypothetical protein